MTTRTVPVAPRSTRTTLVGLWRAGEVSGGQTVGGGGDFAKVETGKAATSDLTLDFLLAAESDPEGVVVAAVRLERGVIVDNVAFAQSAELDRFGFNEPTNLLRLGIRQVDGLREGTIMRYGQGDGILSEILDDILGMPEDFLFRQQTAALGFNQFVAEDLRSLESFLHDQEFDAVGAGIDG